MVDIVSKRGWYFLLSALFIVPGVISMIIPPGWASLESGLNPGIEFTSGSVLSITFQGPVTEGQIQERMASLGYGDALVQKIGGRSVLIRTRVLEEASTGGLSERERIQQGLQSVAPIQTAEFDSVSPIVAQETVRNAFIALLAASVGILLYIWYAFRRVPKAYRYGTCAVIALVHDMLFVLGVFSILGKTIHMEVNSMFIVGMLTVAGYSVHDTIVVFDRIRENVGRHPDRAFAPLVNVSIMETIGRSLNTSLTTLFVLLAMLLIGGPSIRGFLLVLAMGIVIGTYSSIFNASQLLVAWERGEIGRFFRLGRRARRAAATT